MNKRTVYGLPITPYKLLDELDGNSFCVSYATRKSLGSQLDQAIEKVNQVDDGILLVDNGAFTAWTKGQPLDLEGFCKWAADIVDRCPQAVVVVPDVIDGTAAENDAKIFEWSGEKFAAGVHFENEMSVWHLDEPLERLGELIESCFYFIAFGSSGEYAKTGTKKWHARIQEAFDYIEKFCAESEGCYARPWVHMMRAQAEAHKYEFDSADSCNVAANHHRYKKTGAGHVARFAERIKNKIDQSCDGIERAEVSAPAINYAWRKKISALSLEAVKARKNKHEKKSVKLLTDYTDNDILGNSRALITQTGETKMDNTNKTFEVGQVYQQRSIGDAACIFYFKVIRRTSKSVWVTGCDDRNDSIVCRRSIINRDGMECFKPFGTYSMSPTVYAHSIADGKLEELAEGYNTPRTLRTAI